MRPELQTLKKDREANKKYLPKDYKRVLTNKMTLVGHRLFKKDPRLHLAFIIYRLKRDFGFTNGEIADFIGIPPTNLGFVLKMMRPILDSEILKQLGKMEPEKELEDWRNLPASSAGTKHGYYLYQKYTPYYAQLKEFFIPMYRRYPDIKLGDMSEKDYDRRLKKLTHWKQPYRGEPK